MRLLLITVCLSFAVVGLAQSPKKLNAQLTAEYSVLDRQVDSLLILFEAEKKKEKPWSDSIRSKERGMVREEKLFQRVRGYISFQLYTLDKLGASTGKTIAAFYLDSVTNTNSIYGLLHKSDREDGEMDSFFGFTKYEVKDLSTQPVKDQNMVLDKLIKQRKTEKDILIRETERLIRQNSKLATTYGLLEDLDKSFESVPKLQLIQIQLGRELDKQRDLLAKKDPEGLSQVYRTSFPDVEKGSCEEDPEPMSERLEDQRAQFPGGNEAQIAFLKNNLQRPIDMPGVQGKVYVRFMVSSAGEICDVTIQRSIRDCELCSREAVRLVRSMPDWIPAKVGETPVNSYFTVAVIF